MTTQPANHTTPLIAIASGKGGVGKTSFTLNLAAALAKQQRRILVLDADFGLANIDVQLNLTIKKDLSYVIENKAKLADIIVSTSQGFDVIPGRSGHEKLSFMSLLEQHGIVQQLHDVAKNYDLLLIDLPAGLDSKMLSLCAFADETILITTPDPSAITDAYAVLKLLKKNYNKQHIRLLVNQSGGQLEAKRTFEKLKIAAKSFLKTDLFLFGAIPYDRQYNAAVKMQQLAIEAFPNCKASETIKALAHELNITNIKRKRI